MATKLSIKKEDQTIQLKDNQEFNSDFNEVPSTTEMKNYENEYLIEKLLNVIKTKSKNDYNFVLEYINNEIKESTRIIQFNYKVKCFLEDGAYALSRAVSDIVGFTRQNDEKAPSGKNPPTMLDIRFADGTRKKCPFGEIQLPKYGKDAYIDMQYDYSEKILYLKGECEKRYTQLMDKIVERTVHYVNTDSIYRNQAIKITSPQVTPEFINLENYKNINLFLTPAAKFETTAIEARITKTQSCIDKGIDIRFGAILAGTYGF